MLVQHFRLANPNLLPSWRFWQTFCGISAMTRKFTIAYNQLTRRIANYSGTVRLVLWGGLYILLMANSFWTVSSKADALLFNVDANDPMRKASRAVGILIFYTNDRQKRNDGSGSCAAAVISEKYIITNADCADVIKWRIAGSQGALPVIRAELRLGLDGWSLERDVVHHRSNLDTVFEVKLQPIGQNNNENGFGLLEVLGNPSLRFGTVKLLNRNVVENEQLFALQPVWHWEVASNCRVISASSDVPGQFTYTCEGGAPTSRDTFIFSKDGYGLIGIPKFQSQPGRVLSIKAFIEAPHSPLIRGILLAGAGDTQPELSPRGKKIVECVNLAKGNITIQQMRDCAGVWVTPRAMMRCAIGPHCPALSDTINGRAALMTELRAQNLTVDSRVLPRPQDLPSLPRPESMFACKGAANSEAYQRCVMLLIPSSQHLNLAKCFEPDGKNGAACVAENAQNAIPKPIMSCLGDEGITPEKVARCVEPQSDAKLIAMNSCIAAATTLVMSRDCLTKQGFPAAQSTLARCATTAQNGEEAVACLDGLSPAMQKARRIAKCLQHGNATSARSCLSDAVGDANGGYADCVSAADSVKLSQCIMKNSPETKAAYQAYRCAAEGRDALSLDANCTDGVIALDDKTRRTLDCVARAGGERAKLAACAAGAVISGDAARLVGCATTSQGPTSFALCAAGPLMNEEWRIAAECAVQTGGQPYAFAACTATQLTIRELTKCFSSDFKDCYGPNNTIVKAYTNAFKDITQGPGENNEFVKALDGLNEPLGAINSSVEKLLRPPDPTDPKTWFGPVGDLFE